MPLLDAACLAAALLLALAVTARGRLEPVFAVVLAGVAFAWLAGLALGHMGKAFGTGFGQTLAALGPVALAAAVLTVAAGGGDAGSSRVATRPPPGWLGLVLGVVAGTGATPAASLLVGDPLRRALGVSAPRWAVSLLAGHGLLPPSPLVIAAMAVLEADWVPVAGYGLLAVAVAAPVGAWWAGRGAGVDTPTSGGRSVDALAPGILALSALLAGLLILQSMGDLPNEPFGGAGARERVLGLGRPLTVLVVTVIGVVLIARRLDAGLLGREGWLGRALPLAATTILVAGAAGGFQTLCQQTGMAELLAEQALHLPIGVALPFLAAAIVKALQGSGMVATLTAAGMCEPLLGALGLDGASGRALAALAVALGATAVPHLNDPLFWLTREADGRPPHRLVIDLTGAALLQSLTGLLALLVLAALV